MDIKERWCRSKVVGSNDWDSPLVFFPSMIVCRITG